MNINDLNKIMPLAKGRATVFYEPLNAAMMEFNISSVARQASFLSQIAHESNQLQYVRELGSKTYLDKYDTGTLASRLGNTPEDDDDGQLYCGRGLIQITGKDNYIACMLALGIDCVEHPELLEEPVNACRSAAWFWKTHGLNQLADAGDQTKVTRRVNGGVNGLAERLAYFEIAKKVLV